MLMDDKAALHAIKAEICRQAHAGCERLDMEKLAAVAPWSRRQMERRFRECYLTSPARYFRDCQAEVAGKLLFQGDDVLTASTRAGFASPGRLHDAIISRYGMTPGEMRRKGEGVTMYYGTFTTPLGVVLMAATERGLSSLRLCGFGEKLTESLQEMRDELPLAHWVEDNEVLQTYADQLVAYLEERSAAFCPPLDVIQGTTFQREVWAELRKLKPGETITYKELAERVGRPSAVRAVANACGQNNLAIAIPCHRALRSDGSLAGYRWGVEWKKRLLEIEAHIQLQTIRN